jgi:hypothetical protein
MLRPLHIGKNYGKSFLENFSVSFSKCIRMVNEFLQFENIVMAGKSW